MWVVGGWNQRKYSYRGWWVCIRRVGAGDGGIEL